MPKVMQKVGVVIDFVPRWGYWGGLILALPGMIFLVAAAVIARYVFNSPLLGAQEVVNLLLLVGVFSSLAHSWVTGAHVRLELLVNRLPSRWRVGADSLAAAAGVCVFGLLSSALILGAADFRQVGAETEVLHIPLWPFQLYAALCSLLFVLVAFASFVRTLLRVGGWRS